MDVSFFVFLLRRTGHYIFDHEASAEEKKRILGDTVQEKAGPGRASTLRWSKTMVHKTRSPRPSPRVHVVLRCSRLLENMKKYEKHMKHYETTNNYSTI